MRKVSAACLLITLSLSSFTAQTPRPPQTPQPQRSESGPDDVIRITTELVQTDVVVTDKNEQAITDLKLSDFELYDNGRKQELHFMEFVSIDSPRRSEDLANLAKVAPGVDVTVP